MALKLERLRGQTKDHNKRQPGIDNVERKIAHYPPILVASVGLLKGVIEVRQAIVSSAQSLQDLGILCGLVFDRDLLGWC